MKKIVKTSRWMVMLIVLFVGFAGGAQAQKLCDDGSRPPCNGGSGGDVPDFSDLIYLYRDASGVPILGANQCQQPIGFNSDLCPITTLDCTGAEPCLVPVDPATCAVAPAFASCTREVDLGRINVARSPDQVLASQLEEVVVNLATADCVTLDPAGRLVTSRVVNGVVTTSEIDSSLQNLAIYKQLIQAGFLGAQASPIPPPAGAGALDTAARALGAAADKFGQVDVDLIVYLNQVMGLSNPTTPTILPKICIDIRQEVSGVVQLVENCFLDYGAYGYNRISNFGALPSPPYIPEGAPQPGWFEYLEEISAVPTFGIAQGPILNAVFDGDSGFTGGNIGGFAQATDDGRAVILFMHNWPVPAAYVTPTACQVSGIETYDVSINAVSGLQAPTQMVDGSEGREFTVTVSNASSSPNAASGAVTVTASAVSGGTITGSPWVFAFTDLAPGASQPWTQVFTTNLGVRTTINWTAVVTAPSDVNPLNNTVQATTDVKVTGSGAGSGGSGGGPGGGGPR